MGKMDRAAKQQAADELAAARAGAAQSPEIAERERARARIAELRGKAESLIASILRKLEERNYEKVDLKIMMFNEEAEGTGRFLGKHRTAKRSCVRLASIPLSGEVRQPAMFDTHLLSNGRIAEGSSAMTIDQFIRRRVLLPDGAEVKGCAYFEALVNDLQNYDQYLDSMEVAPE
jgi:hypothetical protein